MEQKDKPLDTDVVEESQDNELDDLFEAGDEDVQKDAAGTLTLEELNELSGRNFTSKDDFFKHYGNLKSFVGKKVEPKEAPKADNQVDVLKEIAELKQTIAEKDFVSDNPGAKEHITLIRDISKARGVSLSEAYESVKDIVESASAYKKEREIGVNSKQRINPMQSQKLNKLIQNVKTGDARSEEALVDEWFKNRG
jgi:neutral trehalase